MAAVDLNCDLGESFGDYTIGMDASLMPYITSANVACGYHAGDAVVMERMARLCRENGVAIGAHPGFPDLQGFGRRNMAVTPQEAKVYVQYQVGALLAFCREQGLNLHHVKPHGALYNMAAKDYDLAEGICLGIRAAAPDTVVLGLSGSEMIRAAEAVGLKAANEVFADRAYQSDGTLVPRKQPGAMIEDEEEAIARVIRMVTQGKVRANDGADISIRADSVCVHGDNPRALDFTSRIRKALEAAGVEVKAF